MFHVSTLLPYTPSNKQQVGCQHMHFFRCAMYMYMYTLYMCLSLILGVPSFQHVMLESRKAWFLKSHEKVNAPRCRTLAAILLSL